MALLACTLLALLALEPKATAPPGAAKDADPVERAEKARREGDLAAARRLYEQALAAAPTDARAAVGLGETLTDQGDAEGAQGLLLRVVQSLPDRPEPRRALSRAYLRGGKASEALGEATRAVELAPENPQGHVLLGMSKVASGKAEEALASFERAFALHPGDAGALAGVAGAYGALSDPRTEAAYEKAIAADRRNLPLAVEFVEFLWRERHFDRGNAEMERVLRQVPDNNRLRVHYGLNLADQRRFADAARQFDEARRRGDASAEVFFYLGSALWEVGRLEEATARLREAVALAPESPAPRQRLGRLLLFRGRATEAVAELERAARADPKSADISLDLGRAYEAAGKTGEAETAYRRAIELQPDLSVGHYALGTLLARMGRRPEAQEQIAIYQDAFQKEQQRRYQLASRQAELNLGWTELDAGRPEKALEQFSRHADDVDGLRGSASALSRLGRHDEAIRALERALLLDPDNRSLAWELDRERTRTPAP